MLAVIGYNVWTLCCDLIMKWKKLCVDDSVALTGGCYTFVSKWTYMCMLWKFTPCFHGIIWLKWGNFFYHFEGALCDQNLVQTHKHPGLPGHRLVMLFIYSFVICIYQLYIYCKFLFIRLFETFRQSAN